MLKLQVLTFKTRDALEALGLDSICSECRDEIEAVGPTMGPGEAPIQTLFRLEADGPLCARCALDQKKNDIQRFLAAVEHHRQERRTIEQDIVKLTGRRPD